MSGLNKFVKKVLPRALALMLACVCGLLLYAFNYFVLFEPETDKTNIKFDIPQKTDSNGVKTPVTPEVTEKSYNFLVMGHDRAASLTDVIMLINYNIETQNITIMQFPRDTYIEIDDYYYHKVNGLYNYCVSASRSEGSDNPDLDGCRKMAEYLEENLAITIHYSAVMDLDGFEGIVDAIGGVGMYVPMDMYYNDPGQNLYINLKEGYQHLNGNTAEQFVRFRYGYATGDIGRGDAQKLFISAFVKKLQSSLHNADAGMITSLAGNVIKYVDTDIDVADMVFMAKQLIGFGKASAVSLENIRLMTMPGASQMYDGASYYVMNKQYVSEIINEYFNIYDIDITQSFDKNERFTTSYQSALRNLYLMDKENINLTVYNAGSLDENGLD